MTISPSPKADVCRVGERLQVTCGTPETTFLEWELAIVGVTNSISRLLSSITNYSDHVMIPLNSTTATLTFSRVSDFGVSPLITMLVIPSVIQDLNETRITCKERGADADQEAMTTIIIHEGRISSTTKTIVNIYNTYLNLQITNLTV